MKDHLQNMYSKRGRAFLFFDEQKNDYYNKYFMPRKVLCSLEEVFFKR